MSVDCGRHLLKRAELDRIIEIYGKPDMIVSDNGTEFTSNAILRWTMEKGIEWNYIYRENLIKMVK